MSINETFSEHDIGQELEAISGWLDQHLDLLDWVEKDIQRKEINLIKSTGQGRLVPPP